MADYAAILQNPGKNDQSTTTPWWNFIAQTGASVGDQMMRVMLWLLGAIAYALYWLMQLLQQFLLLMTIAAAPVFIGLWMLTGTRSIGMRYFLTLMSLELWPLGWALGNIVTKQMLSAVNSTGRRLAHDRKHRIHSGWFVDRDQRGLLAASDLRSTYWRREPCIELDVPIHFACCDRRTTNDECRDNDGERRQRCGSAGRQPELGIEAVRFG